MTGTFLMRIGGDLGEWRHQHTFGLWLLKKNPRKQENRLGNMPSPVSFV
jgi:hypothetical protein